MALDQATVDVNTMLADFTTSLAGTVGPIVQAEKFSVPGDLEEYFMFNGDYSRASALVVAIASAETMFLLCWGGYQALLNWFFVGNL